MDILKNKFVTGGIAGVVVLALGYYLWTSGGDSSLLTTTESTSPLSQEILVTLGQLQTITLDPAVFTDPVFVSLNNFSSVIPPQQAGRRNPFAPIGGPSNIPVKPTNAAQ